MSFWQCRGSSLKRPTRIGNSTYGLNRPKSGDKPGLNDPVGRPDNVI
jgi:hypothetical protein